MMIQYLHKFFFLICSLVFVYSIQAQAPCSTQPPIEARTDYDDVLTQTNIICNNTILTLMTTNLTDCPNCTFLWSDGTTGQYAFTSTPGVFTVTVTDNAPGGCVGISSDLTITAANLAAPTIAGDSFNVCYDETGITLISSPILEVSNPCPTCTYQWFHLGRLLDPPGPVAGANGTILIGTNYNAATISNYPGSDDFYVQVTDPLTGCQMNSAIIEVENRIVTKPPILSTTLSICDSNTAVISTIDCQGCSYEWYFDNALIPGADTSFYETDTIGSFRTNVTYASGCYMDSDPLAIDTFVFTPLIRATMPSSGAWSTDTSYVCEGGTVELTMASAFSFPPIWSYQWSRNGIDIPGATGYNYSVSTAGLYRVFIIDENGCSAFSNTIHHISSTNGSDPVINATTFKLCGPTDTSILTTTLHADCNYTWRNETGAQLTFPTLGDNDFVVPGTGAGGYYVEVEDTLSGCTYESEIVLLRDTIYPAPSLSTTDNTVCSSSPIVFESSILCAGCTYVFVQDLKATPPNDIDTIPSPQSNYQTDSSGYYQLYIEYSNGCVSDISNPVEATFQTVNAVIQSPALSSICNGQTVDIAASPNLLSCPTCSYVFLRDGVAMQPTQGLFDDHQRLSIGGDYQVVVINADDCSDTSAIEVFQDITVATSISTSAKVICGPGSSVIMSVDSCTSCDYQWYIGSGAAASSITGATTINNTITGYGSGGTYSITVTKAGCEVTDSVFIDETSKELDILITIDSAVNAYPTICNGSSVFLEDTCQICISGNQYQYQWFFDGDTIFGASFESFQVDSAGDYYVSIVDTNNCEAQSNTVTVQEFTSAPGFDLDFSGLGVAIPITYGTFSMDDHLSPSSIHSIGTYTSQTAGAAIAADSLSASVAGSGYHFITYTYIESNAQGTCSFSDTDTLEILGAVDMDIVNLEPSAPAFEACLLDTLQVYISNFTFEPDSVVFVAGGGNTITVPIISNGAFTQFAGVFTGDFFVVVPDGARTGKLTVTEDTSSFESENFFLVQNPSVTINLTGTTQPICSDLDTATFSGLPAGGYFSAHYPGLDTSSNPELMVSDFLLLDSVAGYVSGVQNVIMMYHYTPGYTGVPNSCPQVQDSIEVEVRNAELDSVVYTPIAHCQVSEPLSNLTFSAYPISAMNFGNSYSGTYVLANTLLPSTIDTSTASYTGYDTITYEINNSGCINSSEDALEIWPTPAILDSIPTYLCSDGDTIFVERDGNNLFVTYRGQVIYSDTLYTYTTTPLGTIGSPPDLNYVQYSEQYNLMEITSSNGGIDSINFFPPSESYYFVASNVNGGSTTLTFTFKYQRIA
ncbi:hypothetical protein OAK19_05835, partial [Aureispira]|nr:hypothetical protein [Aureispira sp.]